MTLPGKRSLRTRDTGLVLKSVADRLIAGGSLAILSPFIVVLALAIKYETPGPVFFRQARAGRGGAVFEVYKFRTMVDRAAEMGLGRNVAREDERITRMGKVLRRTSLDELPQLLNVLLGQMSIVGPRPAPADHMAHWTRHQTRRLEMKPGLTGWAQVNGRNSLSWEARIEHDIWYVDHWSPRLDLEILVRTPTVVLSGQGLYGDDGVTTDLVAMQEPTEDDGA